MACATHEPSRDKAPHSSGEGHFPQLTPPWRFRKEEVLPAMRNILRVLGRDFKRLLKAPAALVVVIVLVVLPSTYTWVNVIGFWNPYNNTGNMRVCVVNEDTGGSNDIMGDMNLGNQIVDQLHENTQLK